MRTLFPVFLVSNTATYTYVRGRTYIHITYVLEIRMADQKQSRLQINFGNLKFLLTTPANTTLDNLKEKAAKKCGVSTSFVLQYFDDDFKEWFVVDEDYELPVKGKLQLVELQTVNTSILSCIVIIEVAGGMHEHYRPIVKLRGEGFG